MHRALKLKISLHVQLKAITGKRVACHDHGCNLTKIITVHVILQKHTLKH